MKIKWYDANEAVPAKIGQYLVILSSGIVTTDTFEIGNAWWSSGVLAWARLPLLEDVLDEVD